MEGLPRKHSLQSSGQGEKVTQIPGKMLGSEVKKSRIAYQASGVIQKASYTVDGKLGQQQRERTGAGKLKWFQTHIPFSLGYELLNWTKALDCL